MKNLQAEPAWSRFGAPTYTGKEHSLNYAYYAGEDEVVEDTTPADQEAYARYTEPAPYGL